MARAGRPGNGILDAFEWRGTLVVADMLGLVLRDASLCEIAAAEAALTASNRNPHRCVHRARRALRRTRALIALGNRGDPAFAAVDAGLRRSTRALSRLRDAAVVVETLDRLLKRKAMLADSRAAMPLREDLVRQRGAILSRQRRRTPGFASVLAQLRAAREAVQSLDWTQVKPRSVARAVKRSLRRIGKIEGKARCSRAGYLRHRWRRRLRRYNDQRTLLANRLASAPLHGSAEAVELVRRLPDDGFDSAPHGKRLAMVSHVLGLERDMHLLRRFVRRTDAIGSGVRDRLLEAIEHRLRKLRARTGK